MPLILLLDVYTLVAIVLGCLSNTVIHVPKKKKKLKKKLLWYYSLLPPFIFSSLYFFSSSDSCKLFFSDRQAGNDQSQGEKFIYKEKIDFDREESVC